MFLNPFCLEPKRRAALKEKLRRDGRVALWLYAPGYIDPDREAPLHVDNMTDLTGITFAQSDSAWGPFMHVTDFAHPITRGLPQDWFWGTTNPVGPTFHVEDPAAVALGQVVYALGRCKPGFAVKSFGAERCARVVVFGVPGHARRTGARCCAASPGGPGCTSTARRATCCTPRPSC